MTNRESGLALRVVIVCDKYKGTLTSLDVAQALHRGLALGGPHGGPTSGMQVVIIPVADGGDGSLDVAKYAGGRAVPMTARDSHGVPRTTQMVLQGATATIEVAQICGLGGRTPSPDDALQATSLGVGDAIRAALDHGAQRIVLGIGGTATSDGGAGMLQALGARLSTATGESVAPGGAALSELDSIDLTHLDPRLGGCEILAATDVTNPLLGPLGAVQVYGAQKGADAAGRARLDRGLARWARCVSEQWERPPASTTAGAGAGGGLGFAAMLLGGVITAGGQYFLQAAGLPEAFVGADLVITGEGCLDDQTLHGKLPLVVAQMATTMQVPVVAVVGVNQVSDSKWRAAGFTAVHALVDRDPQCAMSAQRSASVLAAIGATIRRDLEQVRNSIPFSL